MILSDRDIKLALEDKSIVIGAPDDDYLKNIGGSSMDLRLGRFFKVYDGGDDRVLDPMKPESFEGVTRMVEIKDDETPFIVKPGDFVLGVTLEKVKLADDLVARVEGRSSLGRLGIIVHSTAGFVESLKS